MSQAAAPRLSPPPSPRQTPRTPPGERAWRVLRTAHAWLGLAACLVLAVVGLSGALLVYEEPLLRATVRGADAAPVTSSAALADAAAAAERHFGTARLRSLVFGSHDFGLHAAHLHGGGGAWLDPVTLEVVARWEAHGTAFEWLFALHHQLLAGETGGRVLGFFGLAGLGLVLSGFALVVRQRGRELAAWPRRATRRELLRAHRGWGLVASVPLVVLAVTGATLSLPDLLRPAFGALLGGASEPAPAPVVAPAQAARSVPWGAVLVAAQAAFPDARPRLVAWPAAPGRPAVVRLRQPAEWHSNGRTVVYAEPGSGRVLGTHDAVRAPLAQRVLDSFWPLHAARVGGYAWPFVVFLTGLALAALSLAGAYTHLRRLYARRATEVPSWPVSSSG